MFIVGSWLSYYYSLCASRRAVRGKLMWKLHLIRVQSLFLSLTLSLLHCPLTDNGLKCVCIAKCSVRCHTHTPTLTSGWQGGRGRREAIVVLQFKVHFNAIWLPFVPVICGAVHTGKQTVALPVSLAVPPSPSLSLPLSHTWLRRVSSEIYAVSAACK